MAWKDKEKGRIYARERYHSNPEYRARVLAQSRERKKRLRLASDFYTDRKLSQYGITISEFNLLLEVQANKCATCLREGADKNPLCIDHDHESGKVRGLLCRNCNLALGLLRDDQIAISNLLEYIKRHKG